MPEGGSTSKLDVIRDVLKSAWFVLLILGVIAVLFGSATHIQLPSGIDFTENSGFTQNIVQAVGGILIVAGLIAVFLNISAERSKSGLPRLPIQTIKIDQTQTTGVPNNPTVRVSGDITPAKAGVKVFLLRENVAGGAAGSFSLSKGHATTDDQGHWEHPVNLWMPGPFKIYAVVTTEEYEHLFRFYRRVWDAMLFERKKQDPDATSVPGWPNLDALPKTSVVASRPVALNP